jgi:hypothetical protein
MKFTPSGGVALTPENITKMVGPFIWLFLLGGKSNQLGPFLRATSALTFF